MLSERDKAAKRIGDLLYVTVARGATVGEATNARAIAERLAEKWGLPLVARVDGPAAPRPKASSWTDLDAAIRRAAEEAMRRRKAEEDRRREAEMPKGKPGTLGAFAVQMLLRVLDNVHNSGYTYEQILKAIKQRYPNAKTTVSSLRWYEVQLRKAGKQLPKRG